ncbi:MAG: cobalamin biosynthesis protein [Elusimicrobia bacterium]|nr:cobalamin biosynthesis protein [Elusimicrobiota bacterium]
MIAKEKIAIIAITKHGTALAEKIHAGLVQSELFVSAKFKREIPGKVQFFESPIKDLTGKLFNGVDALVYIVSLGAVVRTIAPFLKDKHTDPAVIVVDDKANFVISVLSGHVGGANELTEEIAKLLGAAAVITTASDVGKTIPVDILGRELGWTTELEENITKVSASVVNEEPVGIYQDSGEKNWWKRENPLPKNFKFYSDLRELANSDCKAALIITDQTLGEEYNLLLKKSVLYRPKSLAVGMGCDRGTDQSELDHLLEETFQKHRLSTRSIKNISTVDLKNREAGLLAFCERHSWDLVCYTREELAQLKDVIPNPSEMVMKYLKIPGVSEPAAMLTAKTDQLVVEKTKGKMSTIAVARIKN